MLNPIIRFFLDQKLVTALLAVLLVAWGISTAPFRWDVPFLPSDPVPVDAIPDIGENQQIVYTDWMGRSPKTSRTRSPTRLRLRCWACPASKASAAPPCSASRAST